MMGNINGKRTQITPLDLSPTEKRCNMLRNKLYLFSFIYNSSGNSILVRMSDQNKILGKFKNIYFFNKLRFYDTV